MRRERKRKTRIKIVGGKKGSDDVIEDDRNDKQKSDDVREENREDG